jgi:predicted CoA-binding protein
MSKTTVAILGASEKADRYANKAQQRLVNHGYTVLPVSPAGKTIMGIESVKKISDIKQPVDTVTLYVGPKILAEQMQDLITLKPRRVIFNPGTEDAALQAQLEKAGIHTVEACTLVLLSTDQFEKA